MGAHARENDDRIPGWSVGIITGTLIRYSLLISRTLNGHLHAIDSMPLAWWLAVMESMTCARHAVRRRGHRDADEAHPKSIPVLFLLETRRLYHLHVGLYKFCCGRPFP